MARFQRLEVLNEITRGGLVPVFYHSDFEVTKRVVSACLAGGVRVFEFTNRGDNAYRVFSDLALYLAKSEPSVVLGVGSVVDAHTAALYISSGANFVVGPVLNEEVARICNRRKIAYSPGCGSASEISAAEELGVEICKLFPGDTVGGPNFVKAILGPMPWTRIMPTGGVSTTQESVTSWVKAGVAALGIGSNLIKKEWLAAGDFASITNTTAQVVSWIRQARGENVFVGLEHVGLYPAQGADAAAIQKWYGDTFGFRSQEGALSYFVGGSGRIEAMKDENGTGKPHLAIQVTDWDLASETLAAKGFELEEPSVGPTGKIAYLRQCDPAGNRVHIVLKF